MPDQIAVLYAPENEAISGGYSKLDFDPRASLTLVAGYNKDLNTFENVRLETGVNFLDNKDWEKVVSRPGVQERINTGVIDVVVPSSSSKPDSLSGFKLADARKLISATSHVPTLRKWQENTNNKQVYEAISSRIQRINQGLAL
jgi:hypothetical protein